MFTTSRYASEETRKLARSMAKKGGEPYIARGKKTIQALAEEARRLGEGCLRIVEEKKKKPAEVAVIRIDEAGRWRWEGA